MKTLKAIRQKRGLKQKDVAEYLGIVPSAYNHYESGRNQPDIEMLRKLATLFDVSLDDLINGNEEFYIENESQAPVFEAEVNLPIVASLQCGYGKSGDPYIYIGEQSVPKSFVKKYGKEIVLNYAVGNSMLPLIRPGELMICYPSDWWDDGTVVIVNVNGTDTVKRIYRAEDGGIDLVPENPEYKSVHFTPQELDEYQVHVLAHVITTIPPEITPAPRRDK